jgi:hypothetical protein
MPTAKSAASWRRRGASHGTHDMVIEQHVAMHPGRTVARETLTNYCNGLLAAAGLR